MSDKVRETTITNLNAIITKRDRTIKRLKARIALLELESGAVFLWARCYACGHRLAFPSTACPQCEVQFDNRLPPKRWPATCRCLRCKREATR